jgi:pimeloyl-ACP methyl ester carboxylesterase
MSFNTQTKNTPEYKTVELPQGIIHYSDRGQGPVLLFIHGLLVNGQLWRDVVPLLTDKFRCIVPDLPLGSHPEPMRPDADLTPGGIARIVADLITALNLENVTLVGNDTGGAICQVVITKYPENISGLVLTNCDAFEVFPPAFFSPLQYAVQIPGFIFALAQFMGWPLSRQMLFSLLAHRRLEPEAENAYFTPLTSSSGIQNDLTKAMRGVSNSYTLEAARSFSNFDKPVLIVWGENDPFFSMELAERLENAFPNARLERVTNSRTFVPEDQPQALARYLEMFLPSLSQS